MTEQVYAQTLNLIDTFAQKQIRCQLADFEYKLFERMCEAMSAYFGGMLYAFQVSSMKTQIDCSEQEAQFLIWLAEKEQRELEAEKNTKKQEDEENKEPPTEV